MASSIHALCPSPETRVAFLCSPTGYVAFQSHPTLPALTRTLLFEYDARFNVLPVVGRTSESRAAGTGPGVQEGGFVKYDLHDPMRFPKELEGTVDVAVVDVPYLNEVSAQPFSLLVIAP